MNVEPCIEKGGAVDGGGFEMAVLACELVGGSENGGFLFPGKASGTFMANVQDMLGNAFSPATIVFVRK